MEDVIVSEDKKRIMGKISLFSILTPHLFNCILKYPANTRRLELSDGASSHFQAKLRDRAYVTDRSTRGGFFKTVFCAGFRFFKNAFNSVMLLEKYLPPNQCAA